jgi:hypothetical protein
MCRRQLEPQTRVAENDCRVQGDEGEGEIRMDFLQLSKLLLPIIVLRLVCLTLVAERANAENWARMDSQDGSSG